MFWPTAGSAEEPPPAPTVDAVEPVTFHNSVPITGHGQFGGRIQVEATASGDPLRCEGGPIIIPVWDGADVGPWQCVISPIALHNPDTDRENSVEVTVYVIDPQGVQSPGTTVAVPFLPSKFSLPSIPDRLPPGDIIEFAGTRELGGSISVEWDLTYNQESLFDVPRVCGAVGDPNESEQFVCTYDSNETSDGVAQGISSASNAGLALPAVLPLGQYTATLNEMFEDQVINSISFNFTVGGDDPTPPNAPPGGGGGETTDELVTTPFQTIPLAPLPDLGEPEEAIPDGPVAEDPETTTAAPPSAPVDDDDVLRILILAIVALTVMAMNGARGMGWPRRLVEAPVGASGSAPQHLAEPATRDATVAVIAGLGAGGLDGAGDDAGRARPFGDAWGDRSVTWRFPGWPRLDSLSRTVPVRLAPRLPLVARIAADPTYLRAALGVLWTLLPAAGLILGLVAATSGGAAPLPPALGLVAVLLVLAVLDAFAGIAAVTAFTVVTLARGGLTAEGLDLDEGVRGLMGLAALWFVAPLVAAAARPLRRVAEPEHVYSWDRFGDTVIAALISGWAVQGIVGGLGDLTGRDLAITSHADGLALLTIAAVVGRFLLEEATAVLYPRRLHAVQEVDELPAPTTVQQVRGLLLRAGLLAFFAGAFLGSCWQLWVGVAIFAIPQVMQLLEGSIPDIRAIASAAPRGVVQILVLVGVGAAIAYFVDAHGSDDELTAIRQGFVLLTIPAAALEILSVFGGETPKPQWTWPKQLAGAAVVVVTACLVLFLL
ncbi:hypothetical protein GCM10022234_24250 [Aeromicrobium panaciterrae]